MPTIRICPVNQLHYGNYKQLNLTDTEAIAWKSLEFTSCRLYWASRQHRVCYNPIKDKVQVVLVRDVVGQARNSISPLRRTRSAG